MAHYGMTIDTRRCVGCNACTVACKMANNVPEGIFWTRALTEGGDAMDTPAGSYPDVSMRYVTVGCQHCENPACVKVCPVGATYKDPETGVVRQDYDKCIGCRMCMAACPYTGVRSVQLGRAELSRGLRHGRRRRADAPEARGGEVHDVLAPHGEGRSSRLRGRVPRARSLLGRFRRPGFGSVEARSRPRVHAAARRKGTKPSVYYLV